MSETTYAVLKACLPFLLYRRHQLQTNLRHSITDKTRASHKRELAHLEALIARAEAIVGSAATAPYQKPLTTTGGSDDTDTR